MVTDNLCVMLQSEVKYVIHQRGIQYTLSAYILKHPQ